MRRLTFLPWDIYSWKQAFAMSGISGLAIFALMLAGFLQLPDAPGATSGGAHESAVTIWLFRGPLTFLAGLLILSKPRFAKLGLRDLRLWYLVYAALFSVYMI